MRCLIDQPPRPIVATVGPTDRDTYNIQKQGYRMTDGL